MSKDDLNAHLIGLLSGDSVFLESMQHEIQVRPGEKPSKSGHYANAAELVWLMIVVVTFRNVIFRMSCDVSIYGDENVLQKID